MPATAAATTVNYATPGEQAFVVPAGVSQVTIAAAGGSGGKGTQHATCTPGNGGLEQATFQVSPGSTLSITVAGRGGDGAAYTGVNGQPNAGGQGGIGGGGAGGTASYVGMIANAGGGGGGGASTVVVQGGLVLLVAAGGGGCGSFLISGDGNGGNDGSAGQNGEHATGGGAGAQADGGAGGHSACFTSCSVPDGGSGTGGQGGTGAGGSSLSGGGGGGGGGVNGGGGGGGTNADGPAGGGGGGSDFAASSGSTVSITPGANTGNGAVAITYNGGSQPPSTQQAVDNAATELEQSVDSILNQSVKSTIQNLSATIDPGAPGTVDATVVFDGGTGQGSSLFVFEGGGGAGSSILVFDGSGGSGSSLLVFEGGGGSGSSIFAPCSATGDGYDCGGSGGQGSTVLTFEGSGGSGSSVLAPPTLGPGSVNDTLAFEGGGSSGSSIFRWGPSAPAAAAASARHPKKVKLCTRRHKHSQPKCTTLKPARVPFIATTKQIWTTAGPHTLRLPVSKAGKAILTAERELEHLYLQRHPHGHNPPKLPLKIVVSFEAS